MTEHATPQEVYLVVEVSEATYPLDAGAKSSTYASARIPELWIVNLRARRIEIRRAPEGNAYAERFDVSQGPLAPAAFPDAVVAVEDLL